MMNEWLPSQALTGMARPEPLQVVQATRDETVRFGYSIGSLNFLIAESVLSELLRTSAIYPIPNVPPALRGYINRQGALIPVWDLTGILDCRMIEEPIKKAHSSSIFHKEEEDSVLVLGRNENRVGMMIDGLPRAIRNIEKSSRLPMLPASLTGHVRSAVFAEDLLWLEFDHESFFSAQALSVAA